MVQLHIGSGRRRWSAQLPSSLALVACVLSLFASLTRAQDGKPEKTAADYFVKSLPGQPDGPLLRMHAG